MAVNYLDILEDSLNSDIYYTNEDLRMNKKYGYLLSRNQLNEYMQFKDEIFSEMKNNLALKSFNSKGIYYFDSKELMYALSDYCSFYISEIMETNSTTISKNYNEIILSRIVSELDGSLKIEGVKSTRKKILNIIEKNEVHDSNDQIIFNMIRGYEFVSSKPKFDKDNLLKLYKILSYKSLNKEDELTSYYRNEMVMIGGHDGCLVEKIDECMDSLFSFVEENLTKDSLLLPFIVHYYILYIHPYMDFNGRTARMVSLWISLLQGNEKLLPTYISEAINDDKTNYYKAIDHTRISHNDLTYFLTYLLKLANKYYLVYKNVDEIKKDLALIGETITSTESYYLRRIIINQNKGWFNYKAFIEFSNLDITKQGALKILNNFLNLGLLKTKINRNNEKIFMLNDNIIKYVMR